MQPASRFCALRGQVSSNRSFTLVLRAVDDYRPVALLALVDTFAAPLIILAPPNVIYEICPFLFFLFPQLGHRYHLLVYCSDLVRFFDIFVDISEEKRQMDLSPYPISLNAVLSLYNNYPIFQRLSLLIQFYRVPAHLMSQYF